MTITRARLAFDAGVLLALLVAGYMALDFSVRARGLPLLASGLGTFFAAINLSIDVGRWIRERRRAATSRPKPSTEQEREGRIVLYWWAWLTGGILLIIVLGYLVGGAMWLIAFLTVEARATWRFIGVSLVGWALGVYLLVSLVDMRMPEGVIAIVGF